MKLLILTLWASLGCIGLAYVDSSLSPLSEAAEYYFSKHDYSESLKLWQKVYQAHSSSFEAMKRVAELELMLQGHEPAQNLVSQFIQTNSNSFSRDELFQVQLFLNELQSRFVRDEGQSLYFQSQSKLKLKDFSQALLLINQALKVEPGNLLILELKAECEKKMGLISKYYESTKLISQLKIFNESWKERLLEVQFYLKDYQDILKWHENQGKRGLTHRQYLVVGMALVETGNPRRAIGFFNRVVNSTQNNSLATLGWYGLGKAYREEYPSGEGYRTHWSKFVSLMKSSQNVITIEGWDPYRSSEKLAEVTKVQQDTL